MAKKKKGTNKTGGNNTIKAMQNAVSDDEGDGGGLVEDEVDTWAREQDEAALAVLKRGSKAGKEESGRQEVLAMSGDSDSDLELPTARGLRRQEQGVEEEGDIREWGSRKKHYYGGNTGEDPESELDDSEMEEDRAEEVEVGRLQAQQLASMEEEDFLDTFTLPEAREETRKTPLPEVSSLATDLSQLSRKEQAALFQQRAPEFQGVVADFQLRMGEAARLARVVVLEEGGQVPRGPQLEYVRSKLQLLLNYCTNIAAYLMFRAQGVSLTLHPVTGRLVQYRQLLDQLAPMDAVVMPGVEDLLKRMDMGEQVGALVREEKRRARRAVEGGRRKQLSLLAKEQEQVVPEKKRKRKKQKSEGEALENLASLTHDERMAVELYNVIKKTKKNEDLEEESPDEDGLVESLQTADDDTEEKEATTNDAVEYDEEGEEKRAITYKIAKNKGLMPKRSKLQRNPRLKNRMKFEKATKRRKGAVREIRDQKSKYGGEASGVNVRVKLS